MMLKIVAIFGFILVSLMVIMNLSSCQTTTDDRAKALAPLEGVELGIDPEIWPGKKLAEPEKSMKDKLDRVQFIPFPSEGSGKTKRPNQLAPKDNDKIYSLLPRGWSLVQEPYERRV